MLPAWFRRRPVAPPEGAGTFLGLNLKFPENREFNREFFRMRPFWAFFASNRSDKSRGLHRNSLRPKEQGIFSTDQGIHSLEQGIHLCRSVSSIYRAFPRFKSYRAPVGRAGAMPILRGAIGFREWMQQKCRSTPSRSEAGADRMHGRGRGSGCPRGRRRGGGRSLPLCFSRRGLASWRRLALAGDRLTGPRTAHDRS
jgi:hypothetical protein